jgi:hypothetical protein
MNPLFASNSRRLLSAVLLSAFWLLAQDADVLKVPLTDPSRPETSRLTSSTAA